VYEELGVVFAGRAGAEARAEACPWCGKDRCYFNAATGLYDCKHCGEKGNVTTFLTRHHGAALAATTLARYAALAKARGVPTQTLRRHELAYDEGGRRWLVPFKNAQGNVVNLMRYYPDSKKKPNKFMLPVLDTALYGYDRLAAAEKDKPVLLCEGPFDAIAADHNIGSANRPKYVVVATPGCFKAEWAPYFEGRRVRVLNDNDDGGRQQAARVQKLLGEAGVAAEVMVLRWPAGTPDGYDLNDFVREHPEVGLLGFIRDNSFKVVPVPRLAWEHGWERKGPAGPEKIDWVWPDRLRCGTYASFSGKRGTLKSTIVRELIARYTTGRPLPGCEAIGLPPGHVIYVTAEDDKETAWAGLDLAGADRNLVTVLPATLLDGDPMNILEHLDELRQAVRQFGARLVVVDGQNSVVGAPNISTDMLARHNVTNKLHQFAQHERLCLLGVRNEHAEGRAYGPASMSDLGRCILRAEEEEKGNDGERYFRLVFERISDAAPETHPPLPYGVENLGGPARRILWGKCRPPARPKSKQRPTPTALGTFLAKNARKGAAGP